MKTFGTMAIAALAAFLMPATTAYADGVGGYIEYSGYADTVDFPGAGKLDQNGNRIGVGVTYSTNPQGDQHSHITSRLEAWRCQALLQTLSRRLCGCLLDKR